MGVRRNFSERKIFWEGATFEIDDTGANGAENKNRTAQSVNTLICFTFSKAILIV